MLKTKGTVDAAVFFLFATSVALPTGCGSSSGGQAAVTVTVAALPSAVVIGATSEVTAMVLNDASNGGVAWSLSQNGSNCSPGCGTLSSTASASGVAITYTAPTVPPESNSVTVTAVSVTAPTKSSSVTISLVVPDATVTFQPTSLNLGFFVHPGQSTKASTTMTNVGSGPLAISAIGVSGQGIQAFSEANNCGALLGANTFCTITATFTCKKSGNFSGDLSITDNGIGSPQKVHLFAKCKADMTTSVVRSALEKQAAIKAPAATGPFTVGTSVMDVVDTVREDPYLANGTPRELLLRYWYPTAANADCKPAEYTAPKVWSRFSELMGARLPAISTNSCMDAPISEGAHPIVVFTPGYTGTFTDYTFLFEELASRGYVVVSVAHTYESTAVEFPDGRLVESVLGSHLGGSLRGEAAVMAFAVTVRLRDIEFVVNELDRINANVGGPLAGKLDVSRIALAGHSMGGVTALLGVQNSPRFKAGVSIDGDATDAVVGPMQTPFLIVAMGRKQWSDEECHLWGNLNGARLAVNFSGAEHMTPTDGVWIARGAIPAGDMGMDLMLVALRKHIVEFLDATLAGDSRNDPLSDPSHDFPGVTMVTRSQSLCTIQ